MEYIPPQSQPFSRDTNLAWLSGARATKAFHVCLKGGVLKATPSPAQQTHTHTRWAHVCVHACVYVSLVCLSACVCLTVMRVSWLCCVRTLAASTVRLVKNLPRKNVWQCVTERELWQCAWAHMFTHRERERGACGDLAASGVATPKRAHNVTQRSNATFCWHCCTPATLRLLLVTT